ncbi:integrase, catalytic region [Ruegeria lacuscaerulensis ITI-1157]|nr:integrase, catalytic region [Ruegeria lacuscaerulensis ITI-1157]EEX10757.1 integrase, catalytic region [Ruegeria lacuscaerulensis ITI-1157]
MTNPDHKLSLTRQADLLGISRGSLYYEPRPTSEDDLKLMCRIDELHMEYPFAGSRMMKGLLRQEGFTAGRLHVATCMKQMGIQALYRRPNTSKPAPGHKVYPYLLRKLAVTRPNQVWAMDITYIPLSAECYAFACRAVHGAWVRLFGRRAGLVQSEGVGLAAVHDAGNRTVHRGFERGHAPPWQA